MIYKTLFAPHPCTAELSGMNAVVSAARDLDCHLNIVVIGDLLRFTGAGTGFSLEQYWTDYFAETKRHTDERVEEIRTLVDKAGISATIVPECLERGQMDPIIEQYAMTADATIMFNKDIHQSEVLSHIFSSALMQTARPLIMLGETGSLKTIRRALIAWDMKPQSADALRESIPFLRQAEDVTLLSVNIGTAVSGPNPGDDMARYLARHGINVTVKNYRGTGQSVAEVISTHADEADADLIVMGAYGHSRFREWLIGGTTRDMLLLTKRTLLMAH